jgi:hypothetical protein
VASTIPLLLSKEFGRIEQISVTLAILDCCKYGFFRESVSTRCFRDGSTAALEGSEDRPQVHATSSEDRIVASRHVRILNDPLLDEGIEFLRR